MIRAGWTIPRRHHRVVVAAARDRYTTSPSNPPCVNSTPPDVKIRNERSLHCGILAAPTDYSSCMTRSLASTSAVLLSLERITSSSSNIRTQEDLGDKNHSPRAQSTGVSPWLSSNIQTSIAQRTRKRKPSRREAEKKKWRPVPADRKCLEIPVGHMTATDWDEALTAVRLWSQTSTDEGVEKSWSLLDRMVEELRVLLARTDVNTMASSSRLIARTRHAIKLACRAWCKTPSVHFSGRQLADRCFRDFVDVVPPLPTNMCRTILRTASLRDDKVYAVKVVDTMLDYFHEQVDSGRLELQPSLGIYTDALYIYCHHGGAEGGDKAGTIMKRIEEADNMESSGRLYTEAITAYANSGTPEAGDRAEELLRQAIQNGIVLDVALENAVLNAVAKSGDASRAEAFLEQMEHPNKLSYNISIAAYAREGKLDKAEALLQRLFRQGTATKDPEMRPDRVVYNSILDGLSKAGSGVAARQAEAMLQKLYNMAESTGNENLRPDRRSFNSVIHAWARSGDDIAPHRAEVILQRMQDLHESGMLNMSPNVVSFSTTIDCWAKSKLKGSAKRAEAILQRMVELSNGGRRELKPNAVTYASVLDAIANSNEVDAPERAWHVMNLMEEQGVPPTRHAYSALITTWARSGRKKAPARAEAIMKKMREKAANGEEMLDPSTSFMYTTLLNTYARAAQPKEAERILKFMETSFQEGNTAMKPGSVAYGAVLSAWARSNEENAADRAVSIFRYMLDRHQHGDGDMKLTTSAFNAFLSAFTRQGDPQTAVRCEAFLNRMKSLSRDGDTDCKPNSVTYGCVINALGATRHHKCIERMFELLEEMQTSKDPACWPTDRTYSGVLKALSKSDISDKSKRAAAVYRYITVNSPHIANYHIVNDVLRCFNSVGDAESLEFALELWNEVTQPSSKVGPITSLTGKLALLSCLNENDSATRHRRVEDVYRRCCELRLGQKREVLDTLKKVAPLHYENLLTMRL